MRGRVCAAVLVALAAGCGSSRTTIPDDIGTTLPGQPLLPPTTTTTSVPLPGEEPAAPAAGPTTTSPYMTAGLKHTLQGGGTVTVSYPNNNARAPRDVPPPPAGASYAVVTTRLCAPKEAVIPGDVVDPKRFSVEVPGQGIVPYDPGVPVLRTPALPTGTAVAPGTCIEGAISYVIRGERHIESILFDAGEGVYRWVS